jgi:putative inorganic carbon (hco3(-)) transporter
MRLQRLFFILTALYLVFIGGAAYYNLFPAVRFFHHVFITLLIGGWILIRFRNGVPKTPLNLPLYALVIVWFASAVLSIDPRMALENTWFLLIHTLFFFILVDLFHSRREKMVIETQYILAALVIFITLLEVGSWYFGWGIIPGTEVGWAQMGVIPPEVPRVQLAMNISTLLAGYVAPLITITLAGALTVRQKGLRRVLWGMAALLFMTLILTFSRGGWLSFAVAMGIFLTFRLTQSKTIASRVPVRLIGGVAAMGLIAVLVGFIVFTVSQDRRSGDEGRVDMWLSALLIARDHPVLGVGPGLYGKAFREYRDPYIARDKLASAHNVYLNTGAETGLVGVGVGVWLLIMLGRTGWRNWRNASTGQDKLRLEAVMAALIGVGVHSLVDTFTTTPIVLLIVGLVAYFVTRQISVETKTDRFPAYAALGVVLAYGVWFVFVVDSAYSRYLESFQGDVPTRLAAARDAEILDPALNLYDLQIAYLTGAQTETPEHVNAGVEAYREALMLEPTWDVGWMNLGALLLRQGDSEGALQAFTEAQRINPLTVAPLNRAKVAEEYALLPRTPIVTAYIQAIGNNLFNYRRLPLSDFWTATPLREAAVEQYVQTASLEAAYRILAVHDPVNAHELVPSSPQTGEEWWVVGEYALSVENNPPKAVDAFTEAIERDYNNGDYYLSRAKALQIADPVRANRDADFAVLLGTYYELETAPNLQEFAAVLYGGRMSIFELFPELRNNH